MARGQLNMRCSEESLVRWTECANRNGETLAGMVRRLLDGEVEREVGKEEVDVKGPLPSGEVTVGSAEVKKDEVHEKESRLKEAGVDLPEATGWKRRDRWCARCRRTGAPVCAVCEKLEGWRQ